MEEKKAIELTLGDESSALGSAAEEAAQQAAEETPADQAAEKNAPAPVEPVVSKIEIDDSQLSDEEKKVVEEFSKKIDIRSSDVVLQYGSAAQQKIAGFSDHALNNVKTKDLGEVGDMMGELIGELKGFETEEKSGGFFGFFKKQMSKVEKLKARYDSVEKNVDKITKNLENHQITLLKDIALLDELYEKNLEHYKELTMYILAGQKKLEHVRSVELAELQAKAEKSGLPEDAQEVNDLANSISRFEKKIHDLELTRMISLQMGPQIRLVQNNDTLMTEKIQSTLVNTIPLWKSQMVIAVGLSHSREAMKAQRETSEYTNKMLKENAKNLKTATIETTKESERGIVDMETLTETNRMLIETLDEVAVIQSEGTVKREAARRELEKAEYELSQKLKEIRK